MSKIIEIPFGAKDSELKGWEYTIPEGMEAVIEDGKVIVRQKESEDERARKEIIEFIRSQIEDGNSAGWDRWIAYLEKQKWAQPGDEDRYMEGYMNGMNDALKEQKSAEWSEEDEMMLADTIFKLAGFMGNEKNIAWLKSLRPQPHWKPSEEQMEALSDAYVEASTFKMGDILESLYNDLKKL